MAAPEKSTYQTIRNTSIGFAALAVLLVVFGGLFAWRSWETEKEHEFLYLSSIVEITGNSLGAYFQQHERALHDLAIDIGGTDLNVRRIQPLLKRMKHSNPDLRRVNISLPNGQMLVADDVELGTPLPSLAGTPSFQKSVAAMATDPKLHIGRAVKSVFGDEWIIPLRLGVYDQAGKLKYILSGILPVAQQQNFWQGLPLPPNSALGLLRDDGYMVSRYPTPDQINYEEAYGIPRTGKLFDFLRQQDFPKRGVTEGYNSVAKADYLFAFHRLAQYPLTVFVSTPISNLRAKWWQQAQFSLVLAILFLVGGLLVYRWSVRRQLALELEREKTEATIQYLAHHDLLTDLPNRLLASDRFQQVLAHAERANAKAALMFIDLDNFKTINDSLGHATGDALLRAVTARLGEHLRDTDTLSRQGGDEFLVILSDVPAPETVARIAETLLESMAVSFGVEGHELASTMSLGIAMFPDDGRDFDTLLRKADTAMYYAKGAGRNTFRFYTEQMNIDADERLRMRHWLRHALEHDGFVIHYQPQIDLATGAIVGAEALIRMSRPREGLILPGRFIPIAEDSGLIVPMSAWVLREACRQAVAWRQAGHADLVVAVNLSAVQFKRGDLESYVTTALMESGLPPAGLELELTESILIEDAENVLAVVRRLQSLGVKFAIDDFGTGYSSLAYLKRFNVDRLKIDQSFVRGIASDPEDAAIVRAIIEMARSLNITTIAEGVEDDATTNLLRAQRCDQAQGYFYAHPMPPDQLTRFLADRPKAAEQVPYAAAIPFPRGNRS